MRLFALVGLLTASSCFAQQPTPPPEPPASAPDNQTITVPAGTRITVTLSNPVRAKLAHPGDPVRAVTAFPVTVGSQLAIPAGTYVDGVIDKVTKPGRSGHPGLQMHFTRLIFSNGYTIALDGATAEAKNLPPHDSLPQPSAFAAETPSNETFSSDQVFLGHVPPESSAPAFHTGGNAFTAQQLPPPTLPPPPQVGPSKGLVIGAALGGIAAAIATVAIFGRHHGADYLFEAGLQFDLLLNNPVSLDSARVAAALSSVQ